MPMQNNIWEPKRRIEQMYKRAISSAMEDLAKSLFGIEEPLEIIRKLKVATNEPWFLRYAETTAMQMVTHLLTDSGKTWREAAKHSSKGRLLYYALKHEMKGAMGAAFVSQVRQNADYITGVPDDVARQMTRYVMEQSLQGIRASDIAKDLLVKFPDIATKKANLIARTETAKTATALTQARSELLGIGWYRWRSSRDSRVRDSHKLMDGVLINWQEPPNPEVLDHEKNVHHGPYQAGCIWNCRCYTEPVIDHDFITWPCRVYVGGRIVTMTRAQFEKMTGQEKAV